MQKRTSPTLCKKRGVSQATAREEPGTNPVAPNKEADGNQERGLSFQGGLAAREERSWLSGQGETNKTKDPQEDCTGQEETGMAISAGSPASRAGIRGGSASGGAGLFTVGAAERCPEERQQLTGLEKKWLLSTKCLLSMFFEPL